MCSHSWVRTPQFAKTFFFLFCFFFSSKVNRGAAEWVWGLRKWSQPRPWDLHEYRKKGAPTQMKEGANNWNTRTLPLSRPLTLSLTHTTVPSHSHTHSLTLFSHSLSHYRHSPPRDLAHTLSTSHLSQSRSLGFVVVPWNARFSEGDVLRTCSRPHTHTRG